MGCGGSKSVQEVLPSKRHHQHHEELRESSVIQSKIKQALLVKKEEHAKDLHPMSFERILLKFEKMRTAIKEVKDVFRIFAEGTTGLKLDGLQNALGRLHGSLSIEEIKELFDFIDIDESKIIEFNEFFVALTIAMVVGALPNINSGNESPTDPQHTRKPSDADLRKASVSTFHGRQSEVKEMLNMIVSAYLLFDKDGEGVIRRESVDAMLDEAQTSKHKTHNAMLNQDRWNELDWDANDKIDFAEFVTAFTKWVDLEEDAE